MMVLVLLLLSTSSTDAAEASRLSNSSCWYCTGTFEHAKDGMETGYTAETRVT
jgi:hypothetical protein